MNYARTANKRPDKADHEVDGVVRRQNAEITHARPKGIQRSQRLALLQIIFVGEHAPLGTAAGPGRIDDAGHVLALARDEHGVTLASKIFPAMSTRKIGPRRGLRDQDGL